MDDHQTVIESFYSSFQQLDSDGMIECYHPDICFSDPIFPCLQKEEAGLMWRMLCNNAKGFELHFSDIFTNKTSGGAYWEAKYLFSKTERPVHNKIKASFKFQDGKIIQHTDDFNFWRWSIMALGPIGIALGWSPMLKNKVRAQAAKSLAHFSQQHK